MDLLRSSSSESFRLLEAVASSISFDAIDSLPALTATTTTTPAPNDAAIVVTLTFAMLVVNYVIRSIVVMPFLRYSLRGACGDKKIVKMTQSVMEIIIYGGFSVIGAFIVWREQDILWPSLKWWDGYENSSGNVHFEMSDRFRGYYLLYLSRYLMATLTLLLFEVRRSDFVSMVLHHATTVLVIVVSYSYGFTRVGGVIMVLFDPVDVPLHMAKVCKYLHECEVSSVLGVVKDRLFEVFFLSFVITRLIMYPYVCWSVQVEVPMYFEVTAAARFAQALLYILLLLQIYWAWLILKIVYKGLVDGEIEDIRSDDEESDDEEDGYVKTTTTSVTKKKRKKRKKRKKKKNRGGVHPPQAAEAQEKDKQE